MGAQQSTMDAQQSTIHITNKTRGYTLRNPSLHFVSGCRQIPLPRKLEPSESGNALFSGSTGHGSVGVFTYDLYNTTTDRADKKIAVMFSFGYSRYSKCFAVGVFDRETNCDNDLFFNKMYYSDERGFVRGKADDHGPDLKYRDNGVDVTLGMTNSSVATLKVEQI